MTVNMKRISTSLKDARATASDGIDLSAEFDAVVIGSGYGGAISAAKLTLAGQKVLLLERGREVLPGGYPDTMAKAQAETQITTSQAGRLTDFNGIMDLHINDDMHVIVGCGLGGTSLLNANVSLTADPRVFTQFVKNDDGSKRYLWPTAYRGADPLKSEYAEATTALGANSMPDNIDLPKLASLKKAAKELKQPFSRPPINVTFKDGRNHFGNFQIECTLCGDCCSGCNYGSKNTTLMNYLPYAQANGATILTEAQVHTVAQVDDRWQVTVSEFDQDVAEGLTIKAKLVVLAAGALGSTKILKRSEKAGLALASDMLGKGFSGNGDILGFGFDANYTEDSKKASPIYSVGAGANPPNKPEFQPGPCIAGLICVDMSPDKPLRDGLVIEDGVAPGALSMMYPGAFFLDDVTQANFMRFPDAQRRLQDIAGLGDSMLSMKDMANLSYTGAVANTQSYLVMSHDDASGELVYDDDLDVISVHWPGVGQDFPYPRDNEILRQASDAIWGNYLPNPTWSEAYGWNLITVHPVGGCRMADTPAEGVVNADCHVYTGSGDAVYDGLMVCDGAVMPTSLGLNPLLTISAVTIRTMDTLIASKGWSISDTPKPAQSSQSATAAVAAPKAAAMPAGLMEMLKDIEDLDKALKVYVKRIDESYDESTQVAKDLWDWAKEKMGGFSIGQRFEFDKAYYGCDMQGDVGPAFKEITGYLDEILSIAMDFGLSTTEKAKKLIAYFTTVVGDISPSLTFDETMRGSLGIPISGLGRDNPISDAYVVNAAAGAAEGRTVVGNFTVTSPDLEKTTKDLNHAAELTGHVIIDGAYGNEPKEYTLSNGVFELLKLDTEHVDRWLMTYSGDLDRHKKFKGYKTLNRRPGSNWWTDLTTLNVDIIKNDEVIMQGQMTLGLQDLLKQAQTISADYDSDETTTELGKTALDAIAGQTFKDLVKDQKYLTKLFRFAINRYGKDKDGKPITAVADLELYFEAPAAALFAKLVFEAYGGLPAYLYNFPARACPKDVMPANQGGHVPDFPDVTSEVIKTTTPDGARIQITRFKAGTKGPVILASGFGVKAMTFALNTTDTSIVRELIKQDYDVWLFDHRASPANEPANDGDYSIDDIAKTDWPWAIDKVLKERADVDSVQVVAHCLGALTVMMSLLGGHSKNVRQLIINQFSVHPVTGWFNQMKSDLNVAKTIRDGLSKEWRDAIEKLTGSQTTADMFAPRKSFDLTTTAPPSSKMTEEETLDVMLNTMLWNVPFPSGEPCYSPTCHRIFGAFGPVYLHANLNQDTHNALGKMVGPVATFAFEQLGLIMSKGRAVNANGENAYLSHPERLDFPIHMMAGSLNELVLPDTTLRTQHWLRKELPDSADQFTRQVFSGYGHLDCFWGRDAGEDIFPSILNELAKH